MSGGKIYYYIYKITHIDSGRYYIGQHSTTKKDDSGYWGSGTIIKRLLKKYGHSAFKREILGYYPDADALNAAEANLVNEQTLKDPLCVNLKTGGECGRHSEKTRAKMSKAWTDPERRAKVSDAVKSVWEDPDLREKRSEGMKAAWKNPERLAKHSGAVKAAWEDPEYRKKMSEASRAAWADPEKREKRSAAMRAAWARKREKADEAA